MKKNMLLAAMFSLFVFAVAASAQTNFSGKWSLDVSKSKLGDRNSIESQTLTVTQTDKEIKVETATKRAESAAGGRGRFGGGDGATTYSLAGKETSVSVDGPMGPMPVALTAKFDGGKLHLSQARTFNGPNGEVKVTTKDTWELGADGKTLTVNRESTSPRGSNSTTFVYTKN